MRPLSANAKVLAAEALGVAYSQLDSARALIRQRKWDSALGRLYFAAFHASHAALADRESKSKRHTFWVSEFNRRFGRGRSWLPKLYVRTLNRLYKLREDHDYEDVGPSDKRFTQAMATRVDRLLNAVRRNTPLLRYPEFIATVLLTRHVLEALEFDYYCPKSYFHKERIQLQVKAAEFTVGSVRKVRRAAQGTIHALKASRQHEYVLGWNNRLGQACDKYLLFLDLDTEELPPLKAALRERHGWLFKSGAGFHFVGRDILSSDALWRRRLTQAARSTALKKRVDQRHVDFSLRRGYSTLRMTDSPTKPFVPFLCWQNL